MRFFVTGATGLIGSAIIKSLVKAGHEVGGMYRNREKEAQVKALGAVPIYGHVADAELYQHFAAESDVVIHAATGTEQSDGDLCEHVIGALKAEGGKKSFILTSGSFVLGNTGGKTVDEKGSTEGAFELTAWRVPLERHVLDQGNDDLAIAVIRPGWVYGGSTGGVVVGGYLKGAKERGNVSYVGDGQNFMSHVHADDNAELYRLVGEKHARGIFHATDGQPQKSADIAAAVAKAAGVAGKAQSLPLAEATKMMGPFASAFTLDQKVSTSRAGEVGWKPQHANVLDFIDKGGLGK